MLTQNLKDMLARNGHFGWIPPAKRTQPQQDAHQKARQGMSRFALRGNFTAPPSKDGIKIILADCFKNPSVIADIGAQFTGMHQLTGSCVGASGGNIIALTSGIQRLLSTNPTKAFIPWWPYPYGRTRFNEGDSGQGEGAVDSVLGATLIKEGVFAITEQGLPTFDTSDGWTLTSQLEMQWSDGASSVVTKWLATGKQHLLGSAATINSTSDMKTAILNGYAIIDGCNDYIGHGSIVGSGASAYTGGAYDGAGGHSTCYIGYWDHPNDGPLFLYWNNWPANTYPSDPAGGPRCSVWVKEAIVARLFTSLGGSGGETMAMSHLNYFPAQPDVLDWGNLI